MNLLNVIQTLKKASNIINSTPSRRSKRVKATTVLFALLVLFSNLSIKLQAYQKQKCCSNGYLFADYLYFKAIADSLQYAQFVPQTAEPKPTSRSIEQNFKADHGFRIGGGYIFPCDRLEIAALRFV